jgi:formyltetrahydrofolate deformylase
MDAATRLLLSCPDRPGLIARVSGFLAEAGCNIVDVDQHSSSGGRFFMRLVYEPSPDVDPAELERAFGAEVAEPLGMEHRFAQAGRVKRVALMASREEHCLLDLLWRLRRGELEGEAALVISNHPDHEGVVGELGIPYHQVPVPAEGKRAAEAQALGLLREAGVELLVLARYMQVLSGEFLDELATPAINIHHSFLPAFAGPQPYERAWETGVKLIGATAHYVVEELDAGPIIEQDIERVTHRDDADTLARIGRDVERVVLARAVKWHLDDRILVDGNRTVVF